MGSVFGAIVLLASFFLKSIAIKAPPYNQVIYQNNYIRYGFYFPDYKYDIEAKCPDKLNLVRTRRYFIILSNNQPPHRQRYIPRRHDQSPSQNETANHTANNEVQRKQANPTAQGAAARYDPEAHPMEAEGQAAEYPEPHIVQLAALHAGGFENAV